MIIDIVKIERLSIIGSDTQSIVRVHNKKANIDFQMFEQDEAIRTILSNKEYIYAEVRLFGGTAEFLRIIDIPNGEGW